MDEAEREEQHSADEAEASGGYHRRTGSCLERPEANCTEQDTKDGNRNADPDENCTHKETPPDRFAIDPSSI
ncbi:hypothetical protein [Ancylobacter mangrovi]|uniref:Uncharacterized protein n=1 Tax=Ancylobacter mangrovi TaxID=2972472 RepID=A0A9X2PEN0_9HYPH|nr:hypothetical protein [Ancylobacter mangrovi]MCS0494222.1 hypothetical protein [Ancylobacter mangrovi]MCS0501051.1 hypothetical protein [Ancylobacter mangrovi]